MIRRFAPSAAALVFALALSAASFAQCGDEVPAAEEPAAEEQPQEARLVPTGSVTIEATSVSVGVGVSWGRGVLTFRNENHPFRVRGLGLVGVGGSSLRAEGTVFNLETLLDFPGRWAQVSGLAVLGRQGSGTITLGHGNVIMTLSATQKGAKLAAGGGTINIEFTDPAPEVSREGFVDPAAEVPAEPE